MSRIRSKETQPERIVRSALHRMGFRFRKNVRNMPGKPDAVLKRHGVVIFVHGCFWHQHRNCIHAGIPKSNVEYWKPKLLGNVERDERHVKNLKKAGWRVFTIWECEITNLPRLESRLGRFLNRQ